MKKKKRWWIIGISGVLLFIFSLLMMNHRIANNYKNRIYELNDVPVRKVGLILGARVWDENTPSNILEDRLLVGIKLYHQGKIKKLIMTGDHGTTTYDEVNTMKAFALQHGVNADDIFMDHAGFRTYDSCYRARDVFGVSSMIIITNEFHLPRALYIANSLGVDAVGVKSDLRKYQTRRYNHIREFFARCKAYLDLHIIKAEPKFLGPSININGSGLVTKG